MTLLSNTRTPKTLAHDNHDSTHEESPLASSSDAADEQCDANSATDVNAGRRMNDVPSKFNLPSNEPTASPSRRSKPHRSAAPPDAMGANNSREEINAAVRAIAAQLNDSNGKLKRPSAASLKPSGRRRTTRTTTIVGGTQRRMGPSTQTRPDAYALDHSPDDAPLLLPKPMSGVKGFSPTREQKAAKQVLAPSFLRPLAEAHAEDQRKINEQLEAEQRAQNAMSRSRKSRSSQREDGEAVAESEFHEEMDTQAAHERNWFPDRAALGPAEDGLSTETAGEKPDEDIVDQEQGASSTRMGKRRQMPKHNLSRAQQNMNDEDEIVGNRLRRSARINMVDLPLTNTKKVKAWKRLSKNQISEPHASSRKLRRQEQDISKSKDLVSDNDDDDERVIPEQRQTAAEVANEDDGTAWNPSGSDSDDENNQVNEDSSHDSDEETNEEMMQPASPDQADPLEMFPHDTRHLDEFTSSPIKVSRKQGHKRKRSSANEELRNTANTSRKRGRFSPASQETNALEQAEERDGKVNNDNHRFYGQWKHLRTAFEAENDIGVNVSKGERMEKRTYKLNDTDVITIINICNSAIEKMEEGEDAVDEFNEIAERVGALYQNGDDGSIPNRQDVRKCRNIYSHLFPALVRLLRKVIETYEVKDEDTQPPGTIRKSHLNIVIGLIELTLDLGEGMKTFEKPRSSLAVVRPVNNSIIAALKPVHAALCRESMRHAQEADKARRAQEALAEHERTARAEQVRRRRHDHLRRIRSEWHRLHIERIWAEGGFLDRCKREHLTEPQLGTEYDQDGQPFERLEVFAPRVGPPPAMVEAASKRVWQMAELDALVSGLKRYQGPDVYWKIFREYCGRTGLLNKYNVTEIVTVAANMKEYFTRLQQEANGQVEDWVKAIPVWTKGYPLGKENTDSNDEEVKILDGI